METTAPLDKDVVATVVDDALLLHRKQATTVMAQVSSTPAPVPMATAPITFPVK